VYSGGQQSVRLNAAAGGAGGSWYVLLEGLAKLIHDIAPGLEIQVVEGGGISNHENVGLCRIPMAILSPPMTIAALAGKAPFEHPYSGLRVGITNLTVNYLQFVVARDIPLNSLEEWPQTGYPLRIPVERVGTVDRMVFELTLEHLGMLNQGIGHQAIISIPARNTKSNSLFTKGRKLMVFGSSWLFHHLPYKRDILFAPSNSYLYLRNLSKSWSN
jgi:hypothetical protein